MNLALSIAFVHRWRLSDAAAHGWTAAGGTRQQALKESVNTGQFQAATLFTEIQAGFHEGRGWAKSRPHQAINVGGRFAVETGSERPRLAIRGRPIVPPEAMAATAGGGLRLGR